MMLFLHRDVLLEKHWKSVIPRSVCDYFFDAQARAGSPQDIPPVMATPHSGPAVAKIASAVFWSTKPLASLLGADYELGNVDLDSLISSVSIIYQFFDLSMGLLTWEL